MTSLKLTGFRNLLTMRLFVLVFLFVNIVALIFIPITPDEVSRQALAAEWVASGQYDYSWPPMLMLINACVKLLGGGAYMTRALFLVVELYLFWRLNARIDFHPGLLALFILPYFALVLSTASPQGLMVVLLPLLVCAIRQKIFSEVYLVSLALCLVNPTCILVLLGSAIVVGVIDRRGIGWTYLMADLLALISTLIIAYMVFLDVGIFMPTLTNNGPLNLFLGNNPDPMSYRVVAEGAEWMTYSSAQYLTSVLSFLFEQPYQFAQNYLFKLIFWFAPFDHFRSGIGSSFQYILFCYVALVQLVCYFLFFKRVRGVESIDLKMAFWISIVAWLVYSIFFVKLRFRIPFDTLIFFAAYFSVRDLGSKKLNS